MISTRRITLSLALLTLVATTALAQTPVDTNAASTSGQSPTTQPISDTVKPAYFAIIGGFEGDTHSTGYAFLGPSYVRPLSPSLAFTARVFANYLFYEFDDGLGGTKVTSPGISTSAGLRFGEKNWFSVQAGPSFKFRTETMTRGSGEIEESETRIGVSLGADAYINPTSHNNIHAMVNYGTEDQYIWSRVAFKEQITNRNWSGKITNFVGAEVIPQGNDQIRSILIGGLFETVFVPSSFSFVVRGGYKRSTFEVGEPRTGPYFGVGIYRQFR